MSVWHQLKIWISDASCEEKKCSASNRNVAEVVFISVQSAQRIFSLISPFTDLNYEKFRDKDKVSWSRTANCTVLAACQSVSDTTSLWFGGRKDKMENILQEKSN